MVRDFRKKIELILSHIVSGVSVFVKPYKMKRVAVAFFCILILFCNMFFFEPYLQNKVLVFADEIPTDTEAPTTPANLICTSKTDSTVDLSWSASIDNVGVSLYRVFDGTSTAIEVSGTNCTVEGLNPNRTYNFVVIAQDAAGNVSGVSNEITVTRSEDENTSIPEKPGNVTTSESNTAITVTWEVASNATGYDIEADGTVIDNGTSISYTQTGLTSDTAHTYRIRAKNAKGVSEWTSLITVRTLADVQNVPAGISTIPSDTAITITWEAVSNATHYEIEVDGTIIDNGTRTRYTQTGLTPNTEHKYRIRTKNTNGTGEWTASITAKTLSDLSNGLLSFEKTNYTDTIPNSGLNTITVSANGTESNGNKINVSDINYSFANNCNGVSINSSTGAITITPFAQAGSVQMIATYHNITGSAILTLESNTSKNLALGKTYLKSEQPEQSHGDTNNSESTDGILAGDSVDGKSYGYIVPENTTKKVDVSIDLESTFLVSEVKVHKWEGTSYYGADNIKIYKSQDGTNYELVDCSSSSGSIWIDFSFSPVQARHIKAEFSKTNNGAPGNDWLFIDEIEVYGSNIQTDNKKASLTLSTTTDNIYNIPVKVNNISEFTGRTFSLVYDTSTLELLDLCGQTVTKEITPGSILGTGITVTNVSDGRIIMTIDKSISANKKWSGIIDILKFKAKATRETSITFEYQ